jgi:hypothetical protein
VVEFEFAGFGLGITMGKPIVRRSVRPAEGLRSGRGTGEGSGLAMSAEPVGPVHPADPPVTAPYEVIHLGGQAAVIVPLAEFLRLRALENAASAEALDDAEDAAAGQDWLAREARGETNYVPLPEVRRRLGLAD